MFVAVISYYKQPICCCTGGSTHSTVRSGNKLYFARHAATNYTILVLSTDCGLFLTRTVQVVYE
jgi:hypothetical protein